MRWLAQQRAGLINIATIVLLATALRLALFSGFVMGDDPAYADYALIILKGGYPPLCELCVFSFRPILLFSIAGCFKLFGWNQFAFVLPILISSIASVYIVYLLGKVLFDEASGLVAALLVSIFPLNLVHATTMANDVMLSFLLGTSVLFFAKGLTGEVPGHRLNFSLAGAFLALAIGVKINSQTVLAMYLLVLALGGIKNQRMRKGIIPLLGAWILVHALFCSVYYAKTGNPFAHIQAELIFNKTYMVSSPAADWPSYVKDRLLFYPRHMFGIAQEGHQGYKFLAYGYFYWVLPIAIGYLLVRRDRKVAFPLLWLSYLFLVMEFAPLRITPHYEPIHRLPRFLEIITLPTMLLLGYAMRDAWRRGGLLRILSLTVALALTVSSLYHASRKSLFFRDAISDGKKAYEFIKSRDYGSVISDQEMKNLLLFHNQFEERHKFKSFEYDRPQYQRGSLVIFGGSRRPDVPPSYTLRYYPDAPERMWTRLTEMEGKKAIWRPKDLVIYEVVREGP